MIEIIYKDNKFLVKGTFEFGFIGTYENKDFENNETEDREINISDNLDDILDDIKTKNDNSRYYKILKDYIVYDKIDGNTIAKVLTEYYNEREKEIKENENLIKSNVLLNIFKFFNAVGYEFWEIKELLIEEELKKLLVKL